MLYTEGILPESRAHECFPYTCSYLRHSS